MREGGGDQSLMSKRRQRPQIGNDKDAGIRDKHAGKLIYQEAGKTVSQRVAVRRSVG